MRLAYLYSYLCSGWIEHIQFNAPRKFSRNVLFETERAHEHDGVITFFQRDRFHSGVEFPAPLNNAPVVYAGELNSLPE